MSSTLKYAENLSLIKSIVNELRLATKQYKKTDADKNGIEDSVKYMFDVLRENQVTERRFCRPQDHYRYHAQTYLTYLQSTRKHEELTQKYFNKGERSVEESAKLVGLEVPKQSGH